MVADVWMYIVALISNWASLIWGTSLIFEVGGLVLRKNQYLLVSNWLDEYVAEETRVTVFRMLLVIGLLIAGFNAWDEQFHAARTVAENPGTDHDALTKALTIIDKMAGNPKPGTNPITASVQVIPGWPELKPHTIEGMTTALAKAGKHEFDLFLCSSRDCDIFGSGFRTALLGASWYQRPNSVSQLQWKLPPGWVIVGYGDRAGMDVLHDAIKETLHVDVPTLNYPARPKAEPYVQFMIGPRPDNLLQLSQ